MTETVTVTPKYPVDANGDHPPDGAPYTLTPLEIAPGNTMRQFGTGGDLEDAEFTVFLPLADEAKIADDYGIKVRGHDCFARVQVWRSQRSGRGGIVVLAKSPSGKS
ncbi:MAG: hypothetical protein E6R06_26070 [Mycobacterium sp.]|nr:MAG: hypothetical protein E6R06_26070 [Mycobacterium sp.]